MATSEVTCSPITIICVVGAIHHHRTAEDDDVSASIFWSFMILVFFVPSVVGLVMLAVLIHLVNYVSSLFHILY